jgi:hypothetical protein
MIHSLVKYKILCHVPQETPSSLAPLYVLGLIQSNAYAEQSASVCIEVRQ